MRLQRIYIISVLFICILLSCAGTCAGVVPLVSYSGGSGTSEDPYLLSTDSDIDDLSATTADWDKYFKLTQDITLVGNHTPIGNSDTYFTGDFDGNGYAVKNLTVNETTAYVGFFGYTYLATIHDLGVEASSDGVVSTGNNVGVLIGYTYGTTVSNCYATGNATGAMSIGGLVGYSSYGIVTNSSATGAATGSGIFVGGLVGYNRIGTVNNSFATGTATGSSYVGGLVGFTYDGTESNSFATGAATGTSSLSYVGGLVGKNEGGTVSDCYATGTATGSSYVGGLLGRKDEGTVSDCFATGTATGSSHVGGLVGYIYDSTVSNSYYSGSPATGEGTSTSYTDFTSFAFVSGNSGLNWNGSGNSITTADNTDFVWKIIDGYTLPYFQYQDAPALFAPYVETISQSSGTNYTDSSTSFWINVTGCSFNITDTVHVNLTMGGQTPITGIISNITYTTVNATFDLTQATAGGWSLYVINPDDQTSTAKNFEITALSSPESFTNATDNFWVNHSWNAGAGDVADSYNVSYNESWLNGTTTISFNHTGLSAHAWSNITVYSYNATYSALSGGVIDNVQVPNNEISILNVSDITTGEGASINFDINFTDTDSDTPVFDCNQSSLFDDFNTSTGEGSWDIGFSESGTYYVEFNVSDGYGSVVSQVMTITVANMPIYVGSGSECNFSSIQAAINDAGDGDTIIVADGTYNENVDVNKSVTLRSENGAASTMVNASDSSDYVFNVSVNNVTINGFNITGATSGSANGIHLGYSDNCLITNNIVNNNLFGIVLDHSENNTLTGNEANDNTYQGLWLSSSTYNTLTDNTASSNSDRGIYLYSSSNNNTLTDNTVNDNDFAGISIDSSNYNTLESNTAMNSSRYGITFTSSSGNTLTSNTAMNNSEYDIVTNAVNEIEALTITENGACISFLSDGMETGIKGNVTNSTSLSGKINVNGYFTVKRTGVLPRSIGLSGGGPAPNITVSYDDSGISSSVESGIDLYKYSNSTWNAVNGTSLNVSSNQVTVTISEGSFGLFRDPNPTTTTTSSSSGTRASVSQGQDPGIVEGSASSVIRVTGGSPVNYDFSDSGTPVLGVSFDAQDDEGLVVAKVQVLSEAPDGVPSPSGNSYQMMSIDVGSEGTITTDNAGNIRIQFKVSKQWIEENNIDVSTIRMTRYHGEQWNDLPTFQEREEDGYIYFYAETPGFSVFEVVGDEVGESSGQVPASTPVVEGETEPVEETKDTPGFTTLAGIVIVSLAFLMSRNQKDE